MKTAATSFTQSSVKTAIVRNPLIVSPDITVREAIAQMHQVRVTWASTPVSSPHDLHLEARSSCVLVVKGEQLLGILTERDIVLLIARQLSLDTLTVREVMASPTVCLRESALTDLFSAVNLLQRPIRPVPLLDDQDRIVGLLTPESLRLEAYTAEITQVELKKRQRIEANLRESERRYATLTEMSPVGIFQTDAEGDCLYANERWCQIAGLTPAEAAGFGWVNGIHPDDRDLVSTEWYAAVQANRPFRLEYRFQNAAGQITWVFGQTTSERGMSGEVVGYVGTITDISDRKQAEQALKVQRDFNLLIAEISSRFVDISPNNLDTEIERTLQLIGEATQVDTSYLIKFSEGNGAGTSLEGRTLRMTHEWAKSSCPRQIALVQNAPLTLFPWANTKLLNRETVHVPWTADAPAEAAIDQVGWQQFNLSAVLVVPLIQKSTVAGVMGFASFSHAMNWDTETIRLLQVMAQTIANAQERAQNEQRLYVSEERLRLALAAVNQGLYDLDLRTGEAIVTPEYATMLGYDPATFQETNAKWIERLHPDDREPVANIYQAYVAGNLPEYKVEFRQRTQAGEWKWILSLGKIVDWDAARQPLRMLGTHTDISDRKQAEVAIQQLNQDLEQKVAERTAALQASEATNRAMLEAVPDLLLRLRHDGTCLTYIQPNVQAGTFLPINNNLSEVLPITLLEQQLQTIETAIETRELQVYEHQFLKQGRMVSEEVRIAALNDSEVLAIVRDITDRKQAEEELRNLSDRLTLAVKSGAIAIWDWNVPDNILTWDDRMYELYGIMPEQFASIYDAWASRLHPDDRPFTEAAIQQALVGEKDYDPEFRVMHPDGAIRFIKAYALVQRNEQGEPQHMIGINFDITDRKQSEVKLLQTTAQLEASNKELEAFAYSVSHDLRSPLRAIDGFSRALLEDYGDQFGEEGRDYFDRIRHNVSRMGTLIDDLLNLSRVSRSEMQYSAVNLSTLVQEQLHELQASEPERQVIAVVAPEAIVSADATLMRVVISNLLQNAWKFTSHHATAHIEFGVMQREGQSIYFVRDDGAGFDMVYANMLFGVFQRLHNTYEFPGTGIGLATVQRAIHRHGGRVWAEGAVEQGATLYFTVPHSHL